MTVTLSETKTGVELVNKGLISEELQGRLEKRIIKDLEFQGQFGELPADAQLNWARRILDQTLSYLLLNSEQKEFYGMAPLVDIGWHSFLLYTREYAEFCQSVGGRFIHHSPCDVPGVEYPDGKEMFAHTVSAMRKRGLFVDEALWVRQPLLRRGVQFRFGRLRLIRQSCPAHCKVAPGRHQQL